MTGAGLGPCLSKLATGLLIGLVIGSFAMTTFAWCLIESSETTRISVAAIILILTFALIASELVNRTLAALIGACVSVAAYDSLIGFAKLEDILQWVDLETLSLLFGMMTIVNVLGETGLFDFLAVWSYKVSAGRFWSLLTLITFTTAIISSLIDNVSAMLLMAPTLIRLSELMQIDPRYLLMITAIASNIGGCATPVGDPPNLIIIGDPDVARLDISFGQFVAICSPICLICLVMLIIYLKLVYGSKKSFRLIELVGVADEQASSGPMDVIVRQPMDQLIEELRLVASFKSHIGTLINRVSDRNLLALVRSLDSETDRLEKAIREMTVIKETSSLSRLEERRESGSSEAELKNLMQIYSIKNKSLLAKCLIVLLVTIGLFFVEAIPEYRLTLGWISLYAAVTLLALSSNEKGKDNQGDEEDLFDQVINKIEWSTLVFFFALFIIMEVITKLGLIGLLGRQIIRLIDLLPAGQIHLAGSVTIVLWTSGLVSAFIDNVPFTTMMVRVIGSMAAGSGLVPSQVRPLVYALALGACLGGNGTLIGSSAGLVTAGISGRHGYPIAYIRYLKFALPITVLTLLVANVYLIAVFAIMMGESISAP